MARTYGPRAPRKNRNRFVTVLSLIIIVVIIAYIYSPFGSSESEPDSGGLTTNANYTTVHPDFSEPVEPQDTTAPGLVQDSGEQEIHSGEPSLQITSPEWERLQSLGQTTSTQDRETNIRDIRNLNLPNESELREGTGVGQITTTTRQPATKTNSEADKLIAEATEMLKSPNMILTARDKFNEALRSRTISTQQTKMVKAQLSELADDWLFNRTAVPGDTLCENYKVQSGDQLRIIGNKRKVPYEILMEINKISDARKLQAGQTIKVINGPFRAVVYRSTFTMDVYLQNTYVRSFTVGLGLPGKETPTGLWRVQPGGKLIEPEWTDQNGKIWYPSDPLYPLGSRWIELEGLEGEAKDREGFAIHGTHKPEELGTAGSQGCIRMENGEAILVYNMLIPVYSTIEVLD